MIKFDNLPTLGKRASMTIQIYQLFNDASYPCFWLGDDGSFWMNDAANNAAPPLSDRNAVRHILFTASRLATQLGKDAFMLPLLSDALRQQSLTLMPLPGGLLATASSHYEAPIGAFSAQIREPLKNIFAVLPLLNKRLEDAELLFTEEIQENCYTLLRLSSNLESVGRLEQNTVNPQVVDLGTLVESITFCAQSVCRDRGVPIEAIIPDHATPVKADVSMLSQAILNMMRNSLQYTQEGNKITLRVSQTRERVILTVEDKGIGIKPEHLGMIFEPYFSVEPYGDGEPRPGLGLGLATVREIVGFMGGTVAAESRFGEGSRITIALPVAAVNTEVLESNPADYLLNRYSPVYIQLSGLCRLPNL